MRDGGSRLQRRGLNSPWRTRGPPEHPISFLEIKTLRQGVPAQFASEAQANVHGLTDRNGTVGDFGIAQGGTAAANGI